MQSPLLKDSSLCLIRSLTSIGDYCTKALAITSNYTVFNSGFVRLNLRFTFWMKPSRNLISDSSAWKIFYFARSVSITMLLSLRSMTIPWSDTWSGNEALGCSNVSDMYCFLTFLYSRLNPSGQMMTGVHRKTFRSHGLAFATFLVYLIRIHYAIRDSNSELLTTYTAWAI